MANPGVDSTLTIDYFMALAAGDVPGKTSSAIGSHNPGLKANTPQSVDNIRFPGGTGALYTFLTTDTTLFISSSDNTDNQFYVVVGLDDNFNEVTRFVTANGQTPVALSGDIFRVHFFLAADGNSSVGDIYLSSDNGDITSGVPNTLANVKAKIDAGTQQASNGSRMCPAGKMMYLYELIPNTSKAADVQVQLFIRFSPSEDFQIAPPFQINQASAAFNRTKGFFLPTGAEISNVAVSPIDGTRTTVGHLVILEDIT